MIDIPDFKEYVFDDQRYLSFADEIAMYCALNRRDIKQLERILAEFDKLTNEIYDGDHNDIIAKHVLPRGAASEEEVHRISAAVASAENIEEDRKALLEGTDLVDDDQINNQAVERQAFATPGERWTGHLILLSGMTKHMELISNEHKLRFLQKSLDGWSRFTLNSLGIVPELAKSRRVIFNGVTYRTSLDDDAPIGEVARRLTLYMPIAVARMATVFLGTEKLASQLEEGIGKSTEPLARQFLRAAILADLGVNNLVDLVETASKSIRGSAYLEAVLARKIYEVAVRFRLGKDELTKLKALVAGIFQHLNDTKASGPAKNALLEGIARERLLIGLGEKS